jgi:succinate-semialdehyde dehydrogenase/glutarate-semialdehyde dehydrogenase
VSLELGGNDAFIVMDDADIDKAAYEAASSRTASAGQVCIAPKRFIVHNAVKEEFTRKVLEHVKAVKMGYRDDVEEQIEKLLNPDAGESSAPVNVGALIGCLINEDAAKKVESQVNHTVGQGAKLLCGGERDGAFYSPTVLADVSKDMDIACDMEIFGPVIPIIGFDTIEEAIEISNQSKYGLSGCVFTNDWKKGMHVARRAESGVMVINGNTKYRNAMQPFGGYKMSGQGNEGFVTLEEMTQVKTIVMKGFYKEKFSNKGSAEVVE